MNETTGSTLADELAELHSQASTANSPINSPTPDYPPQPETQDNSQRL